jgi:hypothetical protein
MNNFFSPKRFARLFVKHTAEHYRTYLMAIAVLIGVIVLGGSFLFFVIQEVPDPGFQTAVFTILMLIAGTLFTSTVFADFGDKNRSIPALTLPASSFEKFLVGWLYSYPIFLVVYTVVFYLALIGLGTTKHWDEANRHFTLFSLHQGEMLVFFVLYSVLHAIALFGAILFRNIHFVKTGFLFFIGIGVLIIVNTLFLKLLTGLSIVKLAIPFGFLNFNIGQKNYSIGTQGPGSQFVLIVLIAVATLIWVAAYYRLKEKQV